MTFRDPYPGNRKILFIGLAESTHTHSWISLLEGSGFNIRLFSVSQGLPPDDWRIPTFLINTAPLDIPDLTYRQTLNPTLEEVKAYEARVRATWAWQWIKVMRKSANLVAKLSHLPPLTNTPHLPKARAESPQAWLNDIIREWKPDIIHTLGVFDGQGGEFYYRVRKQYHLEGFGKWVLQLRGGSDLTLRRLNNSLTPLITSILNECDQIISDNRVNISYAAEFGIPPEKFSELTPVPGTGGVSVEELANSWKLLPSQRERLILIPKAYNSKWSMAQPILEALRLCWDQIKPCRVILLHVLPDIQEWLNILPEEIRNSCTTYEQIPREQALDWIRQARILLAPSLVDGVPNILYEAMACGAFPIVSPLETLTPLLKNEQNVLFARNLFPVEIAQAVTRAMQDNSLVDFAAKNNLEWVSQVADRNKIQEKVIRYYQNLI